MPTKHLKQFSFLIDQASINHGGFATVDIYSHPFVHPTEMVSLVNQAGKIKVYAVVDINQPKQNHQVVIVGTGATIPYEMVDSLYKIGQIFLVDGQFGYAGYIVSELRGVVPNGSDAGLKPVFSIKVSVDVDDEDEVDSLVEEINNFCSAHSSVIRAHLEHLEDGTIELFCYNNEFRHQPEFSQLMSFLYTASAVDGVNIGKSV